MSDPVFAMLLALLSACLHAAWNAAVKSGSDRLTSVGMVDGFALVVCAAAAPFVAPPGPHAWIFIGVSLVFNTLFRLCLIKAYDLGDFGQMYPVIRGVAPLAVAFISVLLMNKPLSAAAWLGVTLISAGIASLVLTDKVSAIRKTPIAYAVAGGLCIAVYTASDAAGVHSAGNVLSYGVYLLLIESIPMPAIALAVRRRSAILYVKSQWRTGLFGGANALLSYGLILWALRLGDVAKVEALRETSVILAAGIGALLFKEPFGGKRIACAAVVATGIVMVGT